MKLMFWDTEFRGVLNSNVDPISMAYEADGKTEDIWVYNDEEQKNYVRGLLLFAKSRHTLVSYSVEAETRFMTSLGLDPFAWDHIDLMLEYRCMLNHDHNYQYGEQLINGKKIKTYPPPPYGVEDCGESHARAEYNLGACVYKLLGKDIDSKEKTETRDIIINQGEFDEQDRQKILRYNRSDIRYLDGIYREVDRFYTERGIKDWQSSAINRAKYAVLSGIRSDRGYHFDYARTKSFSQSVKSILNSCCRDINEQFPDKKFFIWKKLTESFVRKEINLRTWIDERPESSRWPRTPSGKYSLSEEAFSKMFDHRHSFPRGDVGAQILRHLKLKKSLNGFTPRVGGRKTFWDFVGPDGRARPFMNIFGSQSGRSQPSSTGYLLLKSAWMRVLLTPPKGKAMLSLDYSGQEFLLASILSKDTVMLDAYKQEDVYLFIAKRLRIAPTGATKHSHPLERATVKTAMLGILYGLTKVGLSRALTAKLGEEYTEDMADEMIENILDLFAEFKEWRYNIVKEYRDNGYLKTPDNWFMWGDNPNDRSVANFPLQGLGASIMREADLRSYERGLVVPMTLHDALYAEVDVNAPHAEIEQLIVSMREGFQKFFPAHKVKLDGKMWSEEIDDEYILDFDGVKIDICKQFIDERSVDEYEFFKQYFNSEGI